MQTTMYEHTACLEFHPDCFLMSLVLMLQRKPVLQGGRCSAAPVISSPVSLVLGQKAEMNAEGVEEIWWL